MLILFNMTNDLCATDYYWVGGAGNWSDYSNHWATSSGGTNYQISVPGFADNVIFDMNSFASLSQVVSIDVSDANCANMTWVGVTNTPTFKNSWNDLNVYGSLTFDPNMVVDFEYGDIELKATTSSHTITMAGQTNIYHFKFWGSGGEWTLQDVLSLNVDLEIWYGKLITNDQTITARALEVYSSGSLSLGASTVNLLGSTSNDLTVSSSATIDAGTSNIIFNEIGSDIKALLGGHTFYDFTIITTNQAVYFKDGGTFHDLVIPAKTWVRFENGKNFSVSGNISTTATCDDYVTISSDKTGFSSTLSTVLDQNWNEVQLMDLVEGSGNIICTDCIDATGNTNIDFAGTPHSSRTLYWMGTFGGDGEWSVGSNWTENADGSSSLNTCAPTLLDDLVFNSNSIDAANKFITINQRTYAASIDFSAVSNTFSLTSGDYDLLLAGDLILSTNIGDIVNTGDVHFMGASTQNITCAGKTFSTGKYYFDNQTTVYVEDDAYFGEVFIQQGILDAQNEAGTQVSDIYVQEDWYNNGGTFNPRSNPNKYVILQGYYSSYLGGTETFYNLWIDKSSTSTSFSVGSGDAVTISNQLFIDKGEFSISYANADINGEVIIDEEGTLEMSYSSVFNFNSNAESDFNFKAGLISLSGSSVLNIGALGSNTLTALTVGDGISGTAELYLSGGTINITDYLKVESNGLLDVNSGTMNIKAQTADGGKAGTIKWEMIAGSQFEQSGGTINVLGSADNNLTKAIDFSSGSIFTPSNITGGTIVLKSKVGTYGYLVDFGGKTLYDLDIDETGIIVNQTNNEVLLKGDFTIYNGTYNANGLDMTVAKDWSNFDNYSSGNNTLTFDGSTNSTITDVGGVTFNHLVLNKVAVSDALQFDDNVSVLGDYTHIQGTLSSDGTSNTFTVTGLTTVTAGKIDHNDNGVYTFSDFTMNGSSNMTTAGTDASDYIDIGGNIDLNGTATIVQTGTSDIRLTGAAKTIAVEAGVTTSTVELDIRTTADITLNDNMILEDLTTTTAGDFAVATAKTLTLTDDLLIDNALGIFSLEGTASAVIAGDWTNTGGTFEENTSTVTFNGTESSGLANTGGSETFYNLVNNKTAVSDIVATDDAITVTNDFTNTEGTYHINTGSLDVEGVLTLSSGELWLPSGSLTADDATVDMNGGVLDIDGGTIDFDNDASGDVDLDISGGIVEFASGTMTVGDDILLSGTGEIELVSGTITVNSEEATANKGVIMSGGTLDIDGGVLSSANEYVQTGGTLEMGGGNFNVGTSSDALFKISLGTYNLTDGTIDIQNHNGLSNELIIDGTPTVGTISGGTVKISASSGATEINVNATKKLYNLEIATTGQTTTLQAALDIDNNVTLTSGTLSAGSNNMTVGATWTNNSADGTSGFNPGTGTVTMDGGLAQTIGGTKLITFNDLTLNNNNGVTIDTVVTLVDDLTFTDGTLTTTWDHILVMDNATDNAAQDFVGYTAAKYIKGPVRVVGYAASGAAYADTLEVPVGDGVYYSPVRIIPASINSTTWEIRYADTAATSIGANKCDATFNNISAFDRFWVNRTSGTSDAKIRFYWNAHSEVFDQNELNDLILLHWNSGSVCWEALSVDTTQYTRTWADKWIETEFDVTSYSPFAFGSIHGYQLLPAACQTTLTWDGSTDNSWNTASNWDLNTVPCGNDVIIPDVVTDPTLDVNGDCGNLTVNTGGILTLAGAYTLSVKGNLDVNGTGLITKTGTNIVYMTGETKTIDFASDASAPLVDLSFTGVISNTSDLSMTDFSVPTGGRFNFSAGNTVTVLDDCDNDGIISFAGTADSLIITDALDNDGTITLTTNSVLDVNGNIDNASGKTLDLSNGKMHMAGDFTNAGTFTVTGSTVELDGTAATVTIEDADGIAFNNLVLNKTDLTDAVQFDDDITVNGAFTVTQGTLSSDGTTNAFTVVGATTMAAGKITKNDNGWISLADLTMNGSSTIESFGTDANDTIVISGDVDLNGTATISHTGDVDIRLSGAGKTITAEAGVATSTVELTLLTSADYDCSDDLSLEDVTMQGAGDFAMATTKTLTLSDDLEISAGTGIFTLNGTASAVIAGDWTNTGGTFEENSSTVTFNGTENSAISNTGGDETFNHLIINKTATNDIVATDDSIQVSGNFTNTEGTYHINTGTLDIAGTLNLDGGEIWLPSGTLRADESTVDMNGGVLDIDGGTIDFDNDASGDVDLDISGGIVEFASGTMTVGDDILLSGTGEIELVSGTITVNSEEATANKGVIMSGGTLDIDGGVLSSANEYVQTGGTLEMGGGNFNVGTSSDALFKISLGTYNLTDGTIDIQNHNGLSNELIIDGTPTVGTISGGTVKISASSGATEINVNATKKLYNLEIATTGQTVTLIDSLEITDSIKLSAGKLSSGAFDIQLRGNWFNSSADGTASFDGGTGSVIFAGASKQYIRGTKVSTFTGLDLNNSSNVQLDTTVTVSGALTFVSGKLETSWLDKLVMDNGLSDAGLSITGNSSSSYVMGPMSVVNYASSGAYLDTLKAPVGDGVHYSPVYIIPSGTGTNTWDIRYADSSSASVGSTSKCQGNFKAASTYDMFHVNRVSGTENAKLRFYWNANSNITGAATIHDLVIVHYDKANTCWELVNADTTLYTRDWTNKWVETEFNIIEYSPFAFASKNGLMLLPIELIEFNAILDKEEDVVNLSWATASESNNDYFVVEKRTDQHDFQDLLYSPSLGDSYLRTDYEAQDENPYKGVSYYRLKQVDFDGAYSYSKIKTVINHSDNYDLEVRGNELVLKSYSGIDRNYTLQVVDILGRIILNRNFLTNEYITLDYLNLGVYFIQVEIDNQIISRKHIVGN